MGKPHKNRFVVELNGEFFALTGDHLAPLDDPRDMAGDFRLISDLKDAMARTMTVEAEYRYVEIMARRKLQESGDFDEPLTIITHRKRKKTKDTTDIFFTAVPTRVYQQYKDLAAEAESNVILFPLYGMLLGVVERISKGDPVAVVFQHHQYAEVVVGTSKRILLANRYVAFDSAPEQIAGLYETIRTEIQSIEIDHRVKVRGIYQLNWVDSAPIPDGTEDAQPRIHELEREPIIWEDEATPISFFKAAALRPVMASQAAPLEKVCHYARKSLPFFQVLIALMILAMSGAYFYFNHQAGIAQAELTAIEQNLAQIQAQAPSGVTPAAYQDTLAYIESLNYLSRAPAFASIVNDIADGVSGAMKITVMKIDYAEPDVNVEIYGRIDSTFEIAYKDYHHLINRLKRKGYRIADNRFNTEIRGSEFLMKLSRRIR